MSFRAIAPSPPLTARCPICHRRVPSHSGKLNLPAFSAVDVHPRASLLSLSTCLTPMLRHFPLSIISLAFHDPRNGSAIGRVNWTSMGLKMAGDSVATGQTEDENC